MRKMSMRPAECRSVRRPLCCFGHRHIGTSIFRADVMLCDGHGFSPVEEGLRGRERAWMHWMRSKRCLDSIGAGGLLYH